MRPRRPYTKVRRAAAEEATRARIVEAMIALHQEVGPSRTTVSAVAARAGVERLTVYRHFPDELSMFRACSSRWLELHPPPHIPAARAKDPLPLCRRALESLYAWYRANAAMLAQVEADLERSAAVREVRKEIDDYLLRFAAALDRAWPARSAHRAATLRHAVAFSTWRSLAGAGGDDRSAAALVTEWLRGVASRRADPGRE